MPKLGVGIKSMYIVTATAAHRAEHVPTDDGRKLHTDFKVVPRGLLELSDLAKLVEPRLQQFSRLISMQQLVADFLERYLVRRAAAAPHFAMLSPCCRTRATFARRIGARL